MTAAFRIFSPDDSSSERVLDRFVQVPPKEPETGFTIWQAITARLEYAALRVRSGSFDPDFYKSLHLYLNRFASAWSVQLPDSRMVLVPRKEEGQRRPPPLGASNEAQAIEIGWKIASEMLPGSKGIPNGIRVCINGARPLSDCRGDDLVRWQAGNPQWKSGHSVANNLSAIVDCFLWFCEEHELRCPYKRKHIPAVFKPARREATDAEYVALMHGGCRELRRALWCLYNLHGIRTKEMRELRWDHFHWDGAFILCIKNKTVRKTQRPRVWALTSRQERFFKTLFNKKPEGSTHVFLNTKGKPWTRRALAKQIRTTAVSEGLDAGVSERVSAYCFRHTFGTQADEAGMLDQDTSMLMGIPDGKMLRTVYSKASRKIKHLRGASEKAESLRRQNRKTANPAPPQPPPPPPMPLFDWAGISD